MTPAKAKEGGTPIEALSARTNWPKHDPFYTPTARDHMPPHSPEYIAAKKAQGHGMGNLNDQIGGSLNPTWVEWLMGFPLGWTVLEASATPSSRKSRKS